MTLPYPLRSIDWKYGYNTTVPTKSVKDMSHDELAEYVEQLSEYVVMLGESVENLLERE